MMARCDGEVHCNDGSDEQLCRVVVPNVGYNKNLIPPPKTGDKYLYINVTYNFKEILYIDEVENFIRINYNLQKDWYNTFLTFQNLKKNTENLIFHEDKDMIWTPWIHSNNVESIDKYRRANEMEIFKVVPNEKFYYKHNSKMDYQNAHLFEERPNIKIFEAICLGMGNRQMLRKFIVLSIISFYSAFRVQKIICHRTGVGHQIILAILNINGIHLIHKVVTLSRASLARTSSLDLLTLFTLAGLNLENTLLMKCITAKWTRVVGMDSL